MVDKFELYKIECITNMHVGSGEVTYNIIDNQVQRDVVTGYPTINGSSLKGSLRYFLKNIYDEGFVNKIFGSDKGIGTYKVFQAMLLSIPVRSDIVPFFRATSPRVLEDFENFIELSICNEAIKKEVKALLQKINSPENEGKCFTLENITEEFIIEGYDSSELTFEEISISEDLQNIIGKDLIILNESVFKKIVKELPIIARNKLENGESQNLWYEEIVPRETRFYFAVSYREGNKEEKFNKITESLVQIGGNATIGYGYCDIKNIQ